MKVQTKQKPQARIRIRGFKEMKNLGDGWNQGRNLLVLGKKLLTDEVKNVLNDLKEGNTVGQPTNRKSQRGKGGKGIKIKI